MRTAFEEIVNESMIGKECGPLELGAALEAACRESLPRASEDGVRTALLCVDMQRDFMEGGPLGVSGSLGDAARLARFVYGNASKLTEIFASLDTHSPMQIFHPCWWRGCGGQRPEPFTVITAEDVKAGLWLPVCEREKSLEYLEHLETYGQKRLVIWPYHCIAGTSGCALEGQLSKMLHFAAAARGTEIEKIVKGTLPATEFYGVVRPEYDPGGCYANRELIGELRRFDRLVVAGEAKDYCVAQSILQICEALDMEKRRPEIFVLEDCMSCVGGDTASVSAQYAEWSGRFGFRLVKSTEDFL